MKVRYLLLGLLVFLSALFIYWPSIHYPFQFDDVLFLQDSNVQNGRWTALVWPPTPRLLTWLTFLVQYQISGPSPVAYHALNIVLHGLNSVLALLLLTQIFQFAGKSLPPLFAFAGALVFALHPLQTEAILYVYQRSTLFGALFTFLAVVTYLSGRHRLTLLFFLLGLVSKEFVVILPLILWTADGLLQGKWKPTRWLLRYLAVSFLASVAFLSWILLTREMSLGGGLREVVQYAATQVKVIWSYVGLALVPQPLNLDHHVIPQRNLADWIWWLAFGSLMGTVRLAIRLRKRYPLAVFFVILFLALLLPTSSFVPSQDYLFEHRAYPSMLAFAGLLCLGLMRGQEWLRKGRTSLLLGIPFVVIFTVYVSLDLQRCEVWRDEVALWRDAAEKSPGKYRPNYNLGVVLMDRSPIESIAFLSQAIEINAHVPLAYRSLGQVYFDQSDTDAAERVWKQALDLEPGHANTLIALGKLYLRKRNFFRASTHLEEAQSLASQDWRPYYYLAQLNLQFGFAEKAIRHCERGLDRNPEHAGLRFLLADAVAETQNWGRAVELYRGGLQRDPKNSLAYYKLANVYRAMGETAQAQQAALQGMAVSKSSQEAALGESLLKSLTTGKDR